MLPEPTAAATRPLRWERQLVCWLARRHARADGADRPSLEHFRRARRTLREQERLNAAEADARRLETEHHNA